MHRILSPLWRQKPLNTTLRFALIGLFLVFQFVYGGGQVVTVQASAPIAPSFCTATTTNFSNTTSGAIPDNNSTGVSRTIAVSGIGTYLWDVDVTINVSHASPSNLDIWLTSPTGTVVTLTTDNGGNSTNVFRGTTFDDDADSADNTSDIGGTPGNSLRVNDTSYTPNLVEANLTPEEPLAAFLGENPNGTWTLTVADDSNGTTGTLNSWSLNITHLNGTVVTSSTTFSNTTAQAISSSGTPIITSTIASSGLSSLITKVTVTTNITHTRNDNLDISLTSPTGTVVTITSDNGSNDDNIFNGTVWDDDADPNNNTTSNAGNSNRVADTNTSNNTVETTLTPEEPLGAFVGETPNGTWTLTVTDDNNNDGGNLASWSINITTGNCFADVSVTKVLNTAAPYYAGNFVSYLVTVSNTNANVASTVTMQDTLAANLAFVSLFAPGGWSCTAPAGGASGLISCNISSLNRSATAVFTINAQIRSNVANNTLIGNTASVSATNDNTSGNNTTLPANLTTSIQTNTSITKTDGQTSDIPGTTITYTIVASNAGPSDAANTTITDTLPATLTGATWTCVGSNGSTCTPSGNGNISDSATITAGGSVTYTLVATIAPNATGTLTNQATVNHPADSTPDNNQATDTNTLAPQANLVPTITDNQTTDIPGTSIQYTATVTNNGPSNAPNAITLIGLPNLGLGQPIRVNGVTWEAVYAGGASGPTSGSGAFNQNVNLPVGGSVTYTINATINANAVVELVTDILANSDLPGSSNVQASDITALTPQANLVPTITDNQTTDIPGTSIQYTATVTNNGPSDAPNTTVATYLPLLSISNTAWTAVYAGNASGPASGTDGFTHSVNLPAGGSVTYTINATINANAVGELMAVIGAGFPGPSLILVQDSTTLTPQADISITKTDGQTSDTPGTTITYTITASNAGPSDVPSVTVTDILPNTLTGATWTCVGAGDGTCAASGSGDINDTTVNLPSGGSVTYTLVATIAPNATGTLTNQATVSHPADSTLNNNQATDTNTLNAQADISITKTDGQTSDTPGTTTTYTIVASNAGPSNAPSVTVTDTLPNTLTGATWTCVGAGNGTCAASGSGNINDSVNLPVGGSVTYTLTATIAANATGTLSNTAEVSSAVDSTSNNNSAEDTTTLNAQADISITKTDGQTSDTPGTTITYTIVASNAGPSDAPSVNVTDTLPNTLTGATWTCVGAGGGTCEASGNGNINDTTVNLPSGGSVTYTLTATIAANATGTLSNTATISSAVDSTSNNNSAEDTTTLNAQADISITKTDGQTSDTPGTTITYTIVASNAGPSDAPSVTVTDTLPNTLTGATWTCVGAGGGTCEASGNGNINDATVSLPAGGSVTYTLTATIAANATGTLSNTAEVSSAVDSTSNNNSAEDTTTLTQAADLSVTKTAGAPTTVQGADITYTIKVNNAGPSTANVTLTDVLPTATTYVSLTSPGGWSCTTPAVSANGTVTCNNPAFGVTEDTFTLVVKVNTNAVGGSMISNTAEIASAADSSSGNNSQQADVTVGSPLLSSWAQPANLIQLNGLVGTTPSINIAVSNTGATGTNLNVTLTTPPGSPFTVTNLPRNIAAGTQAFYTIGCSANGTPATGTYTITTNEPGSPTYTYNLSCSSSADTLGVFRPSASVFHLRYSNTSGPANHSVGVGLGTDTPIVGDWNNDSADTVGVFRPSTGQFFLRDSNLVGGATAYAFALGAVGDIPLAGDFNGDGAEDVGFFRPSTQQFLFRYSKSAGTFDAVIRFGLSTDIPIVGDWDGDGKDTPGIYRGGFFYLTNRFTSTTSPAPINVTVRYGLAGDTPIIGDWDANGTVTVGVYRGNAFLLRNSNTAGPVDIFVYYGLSGDKPVVGNWLKPGAVLPIRSSQQPTAPTFTPKQ